MSSCSVEDARFWVVAAMLGWAAYLDVRTRRVPDRYWLPFIAVAAVWSAADVAQGGGWLRDYGLAAAWAVVVYALFRLGLIWGGADAKALMLIGFLMPSATWLGAFPAVDAFANAIVISLAAPLAIAVANLAGGARGRLMFLALRTPMETAMRRHVWPLDRVEDGRVVARAWPDRDTALRDQFRTLRDAGATHVWASPKLPFLGFLLAGWAVLPFSGNVLVRVIQAVVDVMVS